jgi:hypothetical protein
MKIKIVIAFDSICASDSKKAGSRVIRRVVGERFDEPVLSD